jgi:serine/threonine protein kinase
VGLFDKVKNLFGGGGTPRVNIRERFTLLGQSGQGSMSKVWHARDKQLGIDVCLKVLDKQKTREFEDRFKGLQRPTEGEIAVQLRHKNLVVTHEHGLTTDDEPYLVMEWLDGIGLNFLLEAKGRQLDGKRVGIAAQLADGIQYLHDTGFLHRDICPRNVIIGKQGEVKWIDFGLALPYKPEFCKPGNRTGTLDYLAPEIIARKATDHRVDVFALGVLVYELFTGGLPWEVKTKSPEVLMKARAQPGRNPRDLRPDLDDATVKLLTRAVEREPARRFQSAAELKDALRALPKKTW